MPIKLTGNFQYVENDIILSNPILRRRNWFCPLCVSCNILRTVKNKYTKAYLSRDGLYIITEYICVCRDCGNIFSDTEYEVSYEDCYGKNSIQKYQCFQHCCELEKNVSIRR